MMVTFAKLGQHLQEGEHVMSSPSNRLGSSRRRSSPSRSSSSTDPIDLYP